MNTVERVTLIRTSLHQRGNGKDNHSPVRNVTQYWNDDGTLVAEQDPCAVVVSPETRNEIEQDAVRLAGNNGAALVKRMRELMGVA